MTKSGNHRRSCTICGKTFPVREVVAGTFVRDPIADEIRRDHPEWSADAFSVGLIWRDTEPSTSMPFWRLRRET